MMENISTASTVSPFLDKTRWVSENEHAFSLRDNFPISEGHTLIIPKRTVRSIFELTDREVNACWELLKTEKTSLEKKLQPNGFNIGINDGPIAGQTILHAHIHIIPRFEGDHPNPRGGIRAVIPDKADY